MEDLKMKSKYELYREIEKKQKKLKRKIMIKFYVQKILEVIKK